VGRSNSNITTTNERQNTNENHNNNTNPSGEAAEYEYESLLMQIDLLTKEKNALESQLVIIKLKYAEVSSSFGELQDEKSTLLRKVEELGHKLILKEEVISHLLNEKEKDQTTVNSASSSVSNLNCKNSNNNNLATTNYNSNHVIMRELKTTNNIKNPNQQQHANYGTNNNNNFDNVINNTISNNINNNFNSNAGSFTQRNSINKSNITQNSNYSNLENSANEKIIKKIQYNFDESQYSKRSNFNTTLGNEYIESDANSNSNNNSVYNKTEHQLKMENYKALQKRHKNKSIGIIGSIKNFFTNDKK